MKNLKNTKGITLIALIITIIVLLILAGVTIATLTGDNGLLSKTAGAKEENIKGEEREKIALGFNEYRIKKYTDANPQLTVEGATSVTPKDGGGWTVTFPSERVYEVEEDGTITGGETANLPEDSVESLAKAGKIRIGDSISYNPGTATTENINLPAGVSLRNIVDASSVLDWQVLDVNQTTGEVLIIPKSVPKVSMYLNGANGYHNAITSLNAVASIYKNPAYASSSRSLAISDINKLTGQEPNAEVKELAFNHRFGMDSNLNIIDAGEGNKQSRTFSSTTETGFYSRTIKRAWTGLFRR